MILWLKAVRLYGINFVWRINNINEVKIMMSLMKKKIAANKLCTYTTLVVVGAMVGMVSAKMLVQHCCCAEKLKCKAKRALKTMEEKFLD